MNQEKIIEKFAGGDIYSNKKQKLESDTKNKLNKALYLRIIVGAGFTEELVEKAGTAISFLKNIQLNTNTDRKDYINDSHARTLRLLLHKYNLLTKNPLGFDSNQKENFSKFQSIFSSIKKGALNEKNPGSKEILEIFENYETPDPIIVQNKMDEMILSKISESQQSLRLFIENL